MLKFINEEYEKIHKDINRNQYIKRINEIVGNVKLQHDEIQRTLNDVKEVQKETEEQVKKITKMDKEVEQMLAKHTTLLEEFDKLRDSFGKLTMNIQQQTLIKNSTKEVQLNVDNLKAKYSNFEDFKNIENDYIRMQNENAKIEAYISKQG